MRIGIIAALPAEGRCLTQRRIRPGGAIGLSEGALLQISGIGAQRAFQAAETLLSTGATALASWGIAGALDPALDSGTLLLPERVVGPDQTIHHTDAAWRERLSGCLQARLTACTGMLAHTHKVLASPQEKARLFALRGAIAADMESGAVALAAARAEVPFLAVRAVVDPAAEALPPTAIGALDPSGRLRILRVLPSLARHPGDIRALLRLARHLRAAEATLSAVARLAGHRLSAS